MAPCVVIVGPPNSGKGALAYSLDRFLAQHPARRSSVHVVKGSPDATGFYLYRAPQLRAQHEEGEWNPPATVETIVSWVKSARKFLGLVLLDLGGRHSELNRQIFEHCTHYIVIARQFSDPQEERQKGLDSWVNACEAQGLKGIALVRSVKCPRDTAGQVAKILKNDPQGPLEAVFCRGVGEEFAAANQPIIEAIGQRLLQLSVDRPPLDYFDLDLHRDWVLADVEGLGGKVSELEQHVGRCGWLRLGGRAPIWAYAAAMHRALDVNSEVQVEQFDPKWAGGYVRIPARILEPPDAEWQQCLQVQWEQTPEWLKLRLRIITKDKMLPEWLVLKLEHIPLPPARPLEGASVLVDGAAPIWVHLTYSRWLRQGGCRAIAVWDASNQQAVLVYPAASKGRVINKAMAKGLDP